MWVEKYRPAALQDIIGNEEAIKAITILIQNDECPNMLFTGPPGTGKTTTAQCIARAIHGSDWDKATLELNASDDRGIGVVRERIKEFAMKYNIDQKKVRLVILDEADAMTHEAQTALRRIIEDSAVSCRYILMCNYPSNIIEPIKSRTAIFSFNRLTREQVIGRLEVIAKLEHLPATTNLLENVYDEAGGDLRKAINILQSGNAGPDKNTGRKVKEILDMALTSKFKEARVKLNNIMNIDGISDHEIMKQLNIEAAAIDTNIRDKVYNVLADVDYRLTCGTNPEIQLTGMIARLGHIKGKENEFV